MPKRKTADDCASDISSISSPEEVNSSTTSSDEDVDSNDVFQQQISGSKKVEAQPPTQALRGYLLKQRITATSASADPEEFLQRSKNTIYDIFSKTVDSVKNFKYQIRLRVDFVKTVSTNDVETNNAEAYFTHHQSLILAKNDIARSVSDSVQEILQNIELFESGGSGWVVSNVAYADIHIARYRPLRGSTYMPLPDSLARKKAIINPKNNDAYCFAYCILASRFPPAYHAERVSLYKCYLQTLNLDSFTFPMTLSQIPLFETVNNVSINVYGYEASTIYPLFITNNDAEQRDHVNLLLLHDAKAKRSHYCLITKLDTLLYNTKRGKYRHYFCHRCLFSFRSQQSLDRHLKHCKRSKYCTRTRMPKHCQNDQCRESATLSFTCNERALILPLVIYADFECILEPIHSCSPNPSTPYSNPTALHTASGYASIAVFNCCSNTRPTYEPPIIRRGRNVGKQFLRSCIERGISFQRHVDYRDTKIKMTKENWKLFYKEHCCHICRKPFQLCNTCTKNSHNYHNCSGCQSYKRRDHCHFCSKYRGAAHSGCNISLRICRDVVVALHNSKRYDTHIIMQEVGSLVDEYGYKISVLPKSFENYTSFALTFTHQHCFKKNRHGMPYTFQWKLKFIDTYAFLSCSLSTLVSNLLAKGEDAFKIMTTSFPKSDERKLLLKKGIYPYCYVDSFYKFKEPNLPSRSCFYNDLTKEHISVADYDHAQLVFKTFKLNNLGDYHDLYVLTDTLLLADVFENFRTFCLQHYQLDPVHYFTLPSFGWAALLKMTSVKLELLSDPDMYTFFEEGIRGGISTISKRFAKANNPYVAGYDPHKCSTYILYIDANNLYGYAMTQSLPMSNFRWLDENEVANFNIANIVDDSSQGFILEVDLHYPVHLHSKHNDYPLAVEKMNIADEALSPYCKRLKLKFGYTGKSNVKLVGNLSDKVRYILHHRNLRQYMALGMIVTKIHRIVTFEQRAWMKDYIMFNTDMRKKASNSFEKDLFKLLNNSVFGKSMENVRTYVDINLITDPEIFLRSVANPRYDSSVIFNENLVAVKMKKYSTMLNKPIYVGFTVLELSKHLMYDFHYNHIHRMYSHDTANLLFSDTDSLCYLIATNDVYSDMAANLNLFDTSDYPKDHKLYSITNKKVMGKMKDETASIPIAEFVGLRPKMYSILYGNTAKKTAKGISKVVKIQLSHSDYRLTLHQQSSERHEMTRIHNHLHRLYTIKLNKISLCAYDDKRFILDDGINTLAYGHINSVVRDLNTMNSERVNEYTILKVLTIISQWRKERCRACHPPVYSDFTCFQQPERHEDGCKCSAEQAIGTYLDEAMAHLKVIIPETDKDELILQLLSNWNIVTESDSFD